MASPDTRAYPSTIQRFTITKLELPALIFTLSMCVLLHTPVSNTASFVSASITRRHPILAVIRMLAYMRRAFGGVS